LPIKQIIIVSANINSNKYALSLPMGSCYFSSRYFIVFFKNKNNASEKLQTFCYRFVIFQNM